MFNDRGRSLLAVAGTLSALIALLHVVVIVLGPPGYRYFGAPDEFAVMTEQGSLAPAILTGIFAFLFLVWALYAFGGARLIRRPPMVRLGLVVISAVYILRGLSAVPEALLLMRSPGAFPFRFLAFSLVSLGVGLCYAAGTKQAWRRLRYLDQHP